MLAAAALLFSVEDALYTLIYLYVSAQIVDLVVTGLSQRKAIFIISPRWEEISRRILNEIHRGVTILRGQGGYSQREQRILYTVVSFRELATLKQIVRRDDPARLCGGVRHDRGDGAPHRQSAPLVTTSS